MTISSTVRKAGPFSGTGTQSAFPFAFKVFADSDLLVVYTDSSGVENRLYSYSVALNADQEANPGGTVTLTRPLAAGDLLTLSSAVPLTQGLSIPNMGGFYPKVIEQALDKLMVVAQQTAEIAARGLRFAFSDSGAGAELPTAKARAGKFLAFDADGKPTVAGGTGADPGLRGDLASSAGAVSVGSRNSALGSLSRSVQASLDDVVSLAIFGCVGDGVEVSKNNIAWQKAEAYVNNFPASTFAPISIFIPDGIYKYAYTPNFKRPVRIFSNGGATLNYIGISEVLVMGNKAQTSALPGTNDYYEIDNIDFIGAATASHGIYFANWVLQPKVSNCRFLNFGGPDMYAITFQGNNWSIDLLDNRYLTTDAAGFARHWCRVFGVSNTQAAGTISAGQVVNGNYDGGNSRLNALNNWIRFGGDTPGIGYVITGTKSRIVGGGVENPTVGVNVDGTGISLFGAEISQYFETPMGYSAIQAVGNVSGLNVHDCYANLHNTSSYNSNARFFTYANNALVTSATFRDLTVLNAGKHALVQLRDAPNQYANNFDGSIVTDAPMLCESASSYSFGFLGYKTNYHNADLLASLDTGLTQITAAQQRVSSRCRVSSGATINASVAAVTVANSGVPPCRSSHFQLSWSSALAVGNYIAIETRTDDLGIFAGDIATGGLIARYNNSAGATSINATLQLVTTVGGLSTVIASKPITITNAIQGFSLPQVVNAAKGANTDYLAFNVVIAGAGHGGTSSLEILNIDVADGQFPPPLLPIDRARQADVATQWWRKVNSSVSQASAITSLPIQIGNGWATPVRNVKQISLAGAASAAILPFGDSSVYVQPNPATGTFDIVFSVEAEN